MKTLYLKVIIWLTSIGIGRRKLNAITSLEGAPSKIGGYECNDKTISPLDETK